MEPAVAGNKFVIDGHPHSFRIQAQPVTALDLPQKILGRTGFYQDGFFAQTSPLGKVSEPGQVYFTAGNRLG